jgi:hypothetical protein
MPLLLLLLISTPVFALHVWEHDDWDDSERTQQVNEGKLHFIEQNPGEVHQHTNTVQISAQSLRDGWVSFQQCHANIDPVSRAQFVYNRERTRDIEVAKSLDIGRVWVENNTIQVEGVGKQAQLCMRARSRNLELLPNGGFRLRNGPFMRRFLDGYYPLRLSLTVEYPAELMRVAAIEPKAQPGFEVTDNNGAIAVNAVFEGRLVTAIEFRRQTEQ